MMLSSSALASKLVLQSSGQIASVSWFRFCSCWVWGRPGQVRVGALTVSA